MSNINKQIEEASQEFGAVVLHWTNPSGERCDGGFYRFTPERARDMVVYLQGKGCTEIKALPCNW